MSSHRYDSSEKHRSIRVHHHPETAAVVDGYDPALSVMAARPPIYTVSTYCFHSAAEAKKFFDLALGRIEGETSDLIYARINNPNAEMFEDQLVELEAGAAAAASFASGMSAITTMLLTFLRPGDVVLHTCPLYGGTDHVLKHMLEPFGIRSRCVLAGSAETIARQAEVIGENLAMIYIETPANPTLKMTDIAETARVAHEHRGRKPVKLAVDNTFLGPVFQSPLEHGADLCLYSATKFLGGHSDLVAGAVLAKDRDAIRQIKSVRSFLGTICEPFTAWLLQRSLATLHTRTIKQSKNAAKLAGRLREHPKVKVVHYPTLFQGEQAEIYKRQCSAPGGMISFEVDGGEAAAFRFLDSLEIAKLAVSLGSVETLATHPKTTISSEMDPDEMERAEITDGLIRLSVGVEYWRDLASDLTRALEAV